jgi:hypothetical protein
METRIPEKGRCRGGDVLGLKGEGRGMKIKMNKTIRKKRV